MPELPEVEIIRLGLSRKIVGKVIKKVEVLSPKSFFGNLKKVEGKFILNIWRKAKILGIELNNFSLLFHLKMTGQLIWVGKSERGRGERMIGGHPTVDMVGSLPNKSTRAIFHFCDGSKLYFNDQRHFGWVKVVTSSEVTSNNLLRNLGPEPLENGFSWEVLKQNLLNYKSKPVKVALLDQTVVSGVGNIYSSEACFNARLDPRLKIVNMTDQQFKALYDGLIRALRDGIKYGGSTRVHFVDSEGHKGYFLDYAFVYGRDKHPCRVCGTQIQKIQLGGRGTYFCPTCQKV